MPANGDVINTEDSEEALEEKEYIETNLTSEYAVDILKSMIKREDNFQPKVSCKFSPCLLVLMLDFDRKFILAVPKITLYPGFRKRSFLAQFRGHEYFLVPYLIFKCKQACLCF